MIVAINMKIKTQLKPSKKTKKTTNLQKPKRKCKKGNKKTKHENKYKKNKIKINYWQYEMGL
jgi:hypothetical protein